jgi:DNA polymerase-3 subunit gamma/tau
VQGRADLPLAPDEATGFSMTLLRLLAFEPAGGIVAAADRTKSAPTRASPREPGASAASAIAPASRPVIPAERNSGSGPIPVGVDVSPEPPERLPMPADPAAWPAFVTGLRLAPMAAQLAAQTELKSLDGNVLTLALPAAHKHLADKVYADKLKAALDHATGRKWMLAFEVGSTGDASLAAQKGRELAEQKSRAEAAFRGEPFVQDVLARFDAKIRPDSIKPVS